MRRDIKSVGVAFVEGARGKVWGMVRGRANERERAVEDMAVEDALINEPLSPRPMFGYSSPPLSVSFVQAEIPDEYFCSNVS